MSLLSSRCNQLLNNAAVARCAPPVAICNPSIGLTKDTYRKRGREGERGREGDEGKSGSLVNGPLLTVTASRETLLVHSSEHSRTPLGEHLWHTRFVRRFVHVDITDIKLRLISSYTLARFVLFFLVCGPRRCQWIRLGLVVTSCNFLSIESEVFFSFFFFCSKFWNVLEIICNWNSLDSSRKREIYLIQTVRMYEIKSFSLYLYNKVKFILLNCNLYDEIKSFSRIILNNYLYFVWYFFKYVYLRYNMLEMIYLIRTTEINFVAWARKYWFNFSCSCIDNWRVSYVVIKR